MSADIVKVIGGSGQEEVDITINATPRVGLAPLDVTFSSTVETEAATFKKVVKTGPEADVVKVVK